MSVFNPIILISVSVFESVHCFLYYYSSVGQLETGNGELSSSYFIARNCLSYLVFLCIYMKLKIVLPRSVMTCAIVLNV